MESKTITVFPQKTLSLLPCPSLQSWVCHEWSGYKCIYGKGTFQSSQCPELSQCKDANGAETRHHLFMSVPLQGTGGDIRACFSGAGEKAVAFAASQSSNLVPVTLLSTLLIKNIWGGRLTLQGLRCQTFLFLRPIPALLQQFLIDSVTDTYLLIIKFTKASPPVFSLSCIY